MGLFNNILTAYQIAIGPVKNPKKFYVYKAFHTYNHEWYITDKRRFVKCVIYIDGWVARRWKKVYMLSKHSEVIRPSNNEHIIYSSKSFEFIETIDRFI